MIISTDFEGDTNSLLTSAQYNLYNIVLSRIFSACSNSLIAAAQLLDMDIECINRIRDIKGFDHRVLQDAHDIIAAYYRYKKDDLMQLPLLEAPKSIEDYQSEWLLWIDGELTELVKSPTFVRGVVNAAIFENNVLGYLAEEQVGSYLVNRYYMHEWASSSRFVKVYTMDVC